MLFAVIVGDKALKYPFDRAVQQGSFSSENLARRNEKNVVQHSMLERRDNEVVKVMPNIPLSTKTLTLLSPALDLCFNTAGPDATRTVPYGSSPSPPVPPYIVDRSGSSCPQSKIAGFSRSTNGQGRAAVSGPNG